MFHYIIWVHVPNKFRLVDVVADMVRQTTFPGIQLDPKWKDAQDIGELTEKLTKNIGSNKYLIILDDVRSLDELKLFLSVLPECKGSAVVITTELEPHHTASGASSIEEDKGTCWKLKNLCYHQLSLQKLEKEEAGKMFCRRVFGKAKFQDNLKNAAHANTIKDLLDKSLPLAGTLLAGLLRTKKEEEWADVINQLTQQRRRLVQQTEQQEKVQKKQQQQLEEAQINQQPAVHQREMKKKQHQQGETEKLTRQKEERVQDKQPEKEKEPEKMHQIEEEQEANQQSAGQQEEMKKKQEQQEEEIQDKQTEEKKEPEQQQDQPVYRQISLVDQILMLSFDDLPPHLKQCFLYFSAFKAEEPINADKLIRLWVAEGLVRPTDGRTMEKHGRDYLTTLISRCLVNLIKKDYSNNILSISIHERVLAFARSEAHEINFLQVHHSTTDLPSTAIRRLSIRNAFDPHTRLALATPKLRSLLFECPEAPDTEGSSSCCSHYIFKAWEYITGRVISLNIHQCKFLRVVDLQGMVHRSTLLSEIGWLSYLQYLGLTHTGLKKLPRSIKHLRNLQTLDITDTGIKKVPKGIWKIKALRHVLAEELQNGPSQANCLPNLQTLRGVHCKDSALKKLINLRSLGLCGIDKRAGLEDCFSRMECLRSLDLAAKNGVELPLFEVLTMFGLRNLQCLKLDGKVSKSRATTGEQSNRSSHGYLLHNLTKLELYNSELDQTHIDLIAEVPNLADFILGKGSYTKEDMVIPADGFPELKKLQVNNLPLKTWRVTEDGGSVLKQLQEISILNCTALTMILDHLKTLEDLVLLAVKNCPNIGKLPLKSNFQSEKKLVWRTW